MDFVLLLSFSCNGNKITPDDKNKSLVITNKCTTKNIKHQPMLMYSKRLLATLCCLRLL